MRLTIAALILSLAPFAAAAVQPDEMLADPVLEQRARDISAGLRCMVCRNESIDESNADLARDMRLLVRERLTEGDSNAEVVEFVVDRYGEYALFKPTFGGSNLVLWLAGPVMLLVAAGVGFRYLRARRDAPDVPKALSPDEADRLREILDK